MRLLQVVSLCAGSALLAQADEVMERRLWRNLLEQIKRRVSKLWHQTKKCHGLSSRLFHPDPFPQLSIWPTQRRTVQAVLNRIRLLQVVSLCAGSALLAQADEVMERRLWHNLLE